jgi:ParB family chromosome partitioning protein
MAKIALGRGLEALIPTGALDSGADRQWRAVPLDKIAPNPYQPRQSFDEDSIAELAASIKKRGILQPILVKKDGAGYILVAGERRYRAARQAGMDNVPAVMLDDIDEADMLQIALIENLQREDLNPIETAHAYQTLIDKCELTQGQLGERIGKHRASIANSLRLLTLPEKIKTLVAAGKLSEGHARAILSVADPEIRDKIASRIITESMTVRQAESISRQAKKRRRLTVKRKPPAIEDAETFLKQALGTAVKIVPGLKKGRIEIEYYSNEDLTRLLELFRKIG